MNRARTFAEIKRRVRTDPFNLAQGPAYICLAAHYAFTDDGITSEEYFWAKHLIRARLEMTDDSYTAEQWLLHKHGLKLDIWQMQEWRHMWLDQLIAEFR